MKRTILGFTAIALALGSATAPALAQTYSYRETREYQSNLPPDRRYYQDRNGAYYRPPVDRYVEGGYYPPPPPRYSEERVFVEFAPRYVEQRTYVDPRYAPPPAYAGYGYDARSDRRSPCQTAKRDNATAGTVLGALAGGVLGSHVSARGAKSGGTAIGALAGALIGSSLGRGSALESQDCAPVQAGAPYPPVAAWGDRPAPAPYSYERERYSYGH